MIHLIKTQEEFDFYIEELIKAYIMMFSEKPFNRNDTTRDHAMVFFKKTFEHGYIFILTKKHKESVFGFRTVIKTEFVSDFDCIDIVKNSLYLSGIWVDKSIRGNGVGSDLMLHTLNTIKELHKPEIIYVRTPTHIPDIHHVLHKTGFDTIAEHRAKLNGVDTDLIIWGKSLTHSSKSL